MVQTSHREPVQPLRLILVLLAVNLIWRAVWLPVSRGAYTDGILQIDLFSHGPTYWPPLYGLLAHLCAAIPGLSLESAARAISLLAGTLAVVPIEAIARLLFGRRAGLMAALVYTFSPLALRWSLQVMTDAPFMALWTSSLAATLLAAEALWPGIFKQAGPAGDGASVSSHVEPESAPENASNPAAGMRWLAVASLCAALAAMTRYQGFFLFPVLGVVIVRSWTSVAKGGSASSAQGGLRRSGRMLWPLLPMVAVLVWFLSMQTGPIVRHLTQIGERTSPGSMGTTLLSYWYFFEQFVLDSPYFFTYGFFGFFLYGVFRTRFDSPGIRRCAWAAIFLTLAVLVSQSIFQAFQSRYLLPLLPLLCAWAGHGLAECRSRLTGRPIVFWTIALPAFLYGVVFSSMVAYFQGNPFIDLKEAAVYVRDEVPEEAGIFTTESFNEIAGPKLAFWSGGREIKSIESGPPRPGDYVVLSSFYGGWENYQMLKAEMIERYPARLIQSFERSAYPLLPDLMEEPQLSHAHPLWWYLRYRRQRFETVILEVLPPG